MRATEAEVDYVEHLLIGLSKRYLLREGEVASKCVM